MTTTTENQTTEPASGSGRSHKSEGNASQPESHHFMNLEIREKYGVSPMFGYNQTMSDSDKKTPESDRLLTDEELALAIKRGKESANLQEIVGNPLTAEELAMFDMFNRERWSHEKRRAYVMDYIRRRQKNKK